MDPDHLDQGPPPPPASAQDPAPMKKVKKQFPQQTIDQFWDKFVTKFPGKVETILPSNIYAKSRAAKTPKGVVHGQAATKSYDEAKAECVEAVNKISKECRRVNMKYRDPHFDIDFDLKWNKRDCLDGLTVDRWDEEGLVPKSVKRVPDIFEKPVFYDNGATASDVRQGADGDCWFMSALCALANEKHLIDKICVAMDEKVGVYGFVFHRDGSWKPTVIDDKLYLRHPDYAESVEEKYTWDQLNRADAEEEYRKTYQTGSRALYFAQCSTENETWLPLLEKAYAKAHGDYKAIDGGFTGEALEDLTGGVTTELFTTDILDLDQFWKDELINVNKDFLFGCATGTFDKWLGGGDKTGEYCERKGVVPMHAYSIMEAREVKDLRLVRVRNPWGVKEWTGAWSDGSEQWTPEWMELLGHKFGNDGMFWISYEDLIRKYQAFDRTRLFGPEWSVTQQWTSLDVPWSADYNDTKFSIKLSKSSHVVIVLSQLDERYFYGLEGQYEFRLHFRLEKDGEHDYIVRSHGNYLMKRSVSADLELEAGTYSVLMKVTAKRFPNRATPEEVVREYSKRSQDKLLMIGMAYDLAHAKAQIKETEQEKELREQREKKREATEHKKLREKYRALKYRRWLRAKKAHEREKRHAQARENRRRKKADERKAGNPPDDTAKDRNPLPVPDSQMLSVKGEMPKAEEQATGGARKTAPLETVPELPSPQAEGPTKDSEPAKADIPDKDQPADANKHKPTEDRTNFFPQPLATIPQLTVPAPACPPGPPSTAAGPLDDDYSSDASFNSSIDTDLDGLYLSAPPDRNDEGPPPADDEVDADAEFENDPWNAVCVVGLRVYSKDPQLSVLIVRPKNEDDDEETPLDVDDPSKAACEEEVPGTEEGGEGGG